MPCLSGRVFRASNKVCVCGSRPTTFPGIGVRLTSASCPLDVRFGGRTYGRSSSLVAGLIDRRL
eukprot:5652357-Heterocapsa_arctica.AAC.1